MSFGYKCVWLAVRRAEPGRVVEALGMSKARRVGYEKGIAAAYEGRLFVTAPVDGWVLAVSTALPTITDEDGGPAAPLIVRLSRDLDTTVRFFASHRVSDYHAWASAERGTLARAFASYDGTYVDIGDLTEPERELGLEFDDLEDAAEDEDVRLPDEEDVVALAARWSVDPLALDGDKVRDGWLA